MDKLMEIRREYFKPSYLEQVCKNSKILNDILITGKRCIGDNPSAHTGAFVNATEALAQLNEKLESLSPEIKKAFDNIVILNTTLSLRKILESSGTTCIHGVGFNLCDIYFSAFDTIKVYYKTIGNLKDFKLKLMPGVINIPIGDKTCYLLAYPNNENKDYAKRFEYCIIGWYNGKMGRIAYYYYDGQLRMDPHFPVRISPNKMRNYIPDLIKDDDSYIANRFSLD